MAIFDGWNRPSYKQLSSPDESAFRGAIALRPQTQNPLEIYQVALEKRIIIVEGISGSGKDTFQAYLKQILKDRAVYDFSEGEVLHSWKQLHIEGIARLRVKLMKLLVRYMRSTLKRDSNAVFLLNRFHLSTYFSTIIRQPNLEKDYEDIIVALRKLPVYIFVLLLDEKEMEARSRHPERSDAWRRHQTEIVNKERFSDNLKRHIWQQQLILRAVREQQLPYSLMKLAINPRGEANWLMANDVDQNDHRAKRLSNDKRGSMNKRRASPIQRVKEAV